jgi:hypothetical protein
MRSRVLIFDCALGKTAQLHLLSPDVNMSSSYDSLTFGLILIILPFELTPQPTGYRASTVFQL